ncbi:class I SAM-dependent methyltransferase [Candidatus Micrarchaeota archaeon]|nr:class I SAM-dependent methyltransferase [Candidatus Micrarchaeota archaeon]
MKIFCEIMQERIQKILENTKLVNAVHEDFTHTFRQLGLSNFHAKKLSRNVLWLLGENKPLKHVETKILGMLERTRVRQKNGKTLTLPQILQEKLSNRADLIFSQIAPHLKGVSGKVLDFGCGDGQVTHLISEKLGLDVEGIDVKHYPASHVNVPIRLFDGKRVYAKPGTFSAAVITNVLHHEKENELILKELKRLKIKKLVIIETVPVGKTPKEILLDRERTFMNDHLYNRLFHSADIPVPGTYETAKGWVSRFKKIGYKVSHSQDLGFDQPTIRDSHHLLVFELMKKAK